MTRSGNDGPRPAGRPGRALAAAAVLALAAGAAALRAAPATGSGAHPVTGGYGFALAAAFALGAGYTAARYRTHIRLTLSQTPGTAVDRLRTATAVILFTGAAAVPLALILLNRRASDPQGEAADPPAPSPLPVTPSPLAAPHTRQPHPAGNGLHLDLGLLLMITAAVLLIGAAVALALLFTRLLRTAEPAPQVSAGPPADPADDALAEALAAGRGALHGDDARAAIIACYAAMESSLGAAGVARERSDSPTDLLRRTAERALPDAGAAAVLTELFREARYSTHPMGAGELAAARGALDTVSAGLAAHAAGREAVAQ